MTEFQKFDDGMRKILSVSREELQKREEEWKNDRKKLKKRKVKTSASGRASSGKD